MTDLSREDVERLAEMGVVMRGLQQSVIELRAQIAALPTREQVQALVTQAEHRSLSQRVDGLERRIEESSPRTMLERLRATAMTLTSVVAAVGAIVMVVKWGLGIPLV